MFQGPLAGRYAAVAGMVLCALVPYLVLSAALQPLTPIIAKDLHTSLQTMSLGSGLANAAYAVGTVLSVALAQHLPQRRMMVAYAVLLVIGSVLGASAQGPAMYITGHVLQGLCTSLLLIAAVPPLAIGYPASKLRTTAVIMNMCIFGAVALGPTIGGLQAQSNAWRPLFWVVAAIAASRLGARPAHVRRRAARRSRLPGGPAGDRLAAVGCLAAFYGASELLTHAFVGPKTIAAVARWAGRDHRPDRLPVPLAPAAVDDPNATDEHDARRGRGGRAAGGGRFCVGDDADGSGPAPSATPPSTSACSTSRSSRER